MPSSLLYRGTLGLAILSLGLAVWHLVAWPQFPTPHFTARQLTVVEPGPPEASPTTIALELTATPSPTPPPEEPPPQRRYTVRPGDTLLGIALEYGVSLDQIMVANSLSCTTLLRVGQELVIP